MRYPHDRFELEEHIVGYPATVTMLDIFGCEVDLFHPDTQEHLQDPIWDTLQVNTSFNLVVRECLRVYQSKREFEEYKDQEYPKAIKAPANDSGVIPDSAFYAVPRLRHVLAEEGLHTVGVLAWKHCRQLRIVKLLVTVVRICESSFQGCYLLGSVDAPGCVDLGYRAFAECCSLQHLSASGGDNTFVAATKLAPYLFGSCLNLSSITLTQDLLEPGQLTPFSLRRDPTRMFWLIRAERL